MVTRTYANKEESVLYAKSLLDDDLSDVANITWRKQGAGYAVLVEVLTTPLDLGPGGIEEPPGGEPRRATVTSPRSPLSPEGTITTPPPSLSEKLVELAVFLHVEEFRRDQVKAEIGSDPGMHLQRQVTVDTRQLADDQWVRLMLAGRSKRITILSAQLIAGINGAPNRSRVVAVEVLGDKDSPQPELFEGLD